MVKKNKTRAEKILADTRHYSFNLEQKPAQVRLPSAQIEDIRPRMPQIATISYDYVVSDIKRTAFITTIILVSQLILFFAMQRI